MEFEILSESNFSPKIKEESNENSQSAGNFTFGFDDENPANLLMPTKDNSLNTGNITNRINNS